MAIAEQYQRQGLVRRVLQALETTASEWQIKTIFLHARALAIPFYLSQGYHDVAPADTLFGTIPHRRMEKTCE
jgi:N-acetylglutamate synthase-like GNAT family acetyltransferase